MRFLWQRAYTYRRGNGKAIYLGQLKTTDWQRMGQYRQGSFTAIGRAKPGELALGRENWLSPVIQATWEATTVGWLEVNTPLRHNRRISGSALWASTLTGRPGVSLRS
jgi:hypothetical protein